MIYAFCSDGAFAGVGGGSLVSHDDIAKSKLGVLDDQMVNYFLNPTALVDPRSVNLSNNKRITIPTFGMKAAGRMLLQFDNTRKGDGNDYTHIRPSYLDTNDATAIDIIKGSTTSATALRESLFNIIEYCFLQHNSAGTVITLPDVDSLDSAMIGESATFSGYVAGSLKVSAGTTSSKIRLDDGNITTGYTVYPTADNATIPFYQFIQFDYRVESNLVVTFKVWLGMEAFLADYPLTTLMKVVYPCNPARLLDMDFTNIVSAITESSGYKDEQLQESIKTVDHSGLSTYISRYVNSSFATYYRMPFTILYKGCVPTSTAMRDFIREELLSLNLADEDEWKAVLPDLFVDGGFYLIPFYNNRIDLIDGFKIDRNIVSYSYFKTKLSSLFSDNQSFDIDWMMQHGSLLMAAGSGLYIYAFPDKGNSSDMLSLETIHPTYMNIDANNMLYWDKMSEPTQMFNQDLALAIPVALGNIENSDYTEEEIDGKRYLAFITNFIEYHLLREDSF